MVYPPMPFNVVEKMKLPGNNLLDFIFKIDKGYTEEACTHWSYKLIL